MARAWGVLPAALEDLPADTYLTMVEQVLDEQKHRED